MYQKYGTNPDQDEIYKEINNMDYNDFLHTPYWDGVRNYKLKSANYRCQLCGKSGKLNVHHKTYENHGREHMRSVADNDLMNDQYDSNRQTIYTNLRCCSCLYRCSMAFDCWIAFSNKPDYNYCH